MFRLQSFVGKAGTEGYFEPVGYGYERSCGTR